MEVPLEDFGHLPQELGCSLHRTADTLTLSSEEPGCAMHFKLRGGQAQLDTVEVSNDPQGRFFRDVVGLVMQIYSGDLEAQLTWSPRGAMEEWVEVRAGETTHPLLFQRLDLVGHQGDQGRDDQAETGPQHGRDLVADRLAAAGRQDGDDVTTGEDFGHHLGLPPAEIRMAPDPLQRRPGVGQRRRICRRRGRSDQGRVGEHGGLVPHLFRGEKAWLVVGGWLGRGCGSCRASAVGEAAATNHQSPTTHD